MIVGGKFDAIQSIELVLVATDPIGNSAEAPFTIDITFNFFYFLEKLI